MLISNRNQSPFIGSLPLLLASLLVAPSVLGQGRPATQNMGEQTNVELEIRRWDSSLGSELRLSGGGIPGTSLDPIEDLGLPDEKTWEYRGHIRFGRFKVRGSWFQTKYEGEVGAESLLSFIGLVVPPGQSVQSRLELEQLRVGLEVDLIRGQYAYLSVIGEWSKLEARTFAESAGTSREGDPLELSLPVFGLKGRTYLTPALAVTVEGTGMKRESEGVITDFEAVVTYNASANFGFSYGYRNSYNRVKSIEPIGRAVFRLDGQFFGATIRF